MSELLILRLIHILGGTFWVGSGLFTTFFLVPALTTAGPAAGPVLGALQQRRLFAVLPTVAVLTIVSGLRLMWMASGSFRADYFATGSGATYALGGAASIAAFLLSLLIARPAAQRSTALMASLATTPEGAARDTANTELAGLRRRMAIASSIAVWLLIAAAVGMAVARYL